MHFFCHSMCVASRDGSRRDGEGMSGGQKTRKLYNCLHLTVMVVISSRYQVE